MDDFTFHGSKVPYFKFSNELLNEKDRFDAWREYMISVADIEPLASVQSTGVFSVETWNLGQTVFVKEKNPGAKFFRTPRKIRIGAEDHFYLYLLSQGSNTLYSYRGKAQEKRSRGIRGIAALHSMADVAHGVMEQMNCLIVFLPRDLFGDTASIMDRHTNENLVGPTGRLISDYISLIAEQLPRLALQDCDGVSRSLVELVMAGFARSGQKHHAIDPDILHIVAKSRIRTYINNNIRDRSLSVHRICNVLGISRASLYRMFEEEGGVVNYIMQRRMNALLKELQLHSQEKNLVELAEAFGFKDAGEMTRNFRRLFDESITHVNQDLRQSSHRSGELAHLTTALRNISSSAALNAVAAFGLSR